MRSTFLRAGNRVPAGFSPKDVGIDRFLGSHPGFEAKFQQFPYDFLVRELDQKQHPIQLVEACDPWKLLDFAKGNKDEHVWFTLVKREQTTPEALAKVARCFQVSPKIFSFCGMKDRWGITTQRVSFAADDLKDVRPQDLVPLEGLNESFIKLGDLESKSSKARLGGHGGNCFTVVLRDLSYREETDVFDSFEELKRGGFPNYFGMQRFGTGHEPSSVMGRALLQGQVKELAMMALGARARHGKSLEAKWPFKRLPLGVMHQLWT
eukprot:symbB.v1.2.020794.t1/scaffold1769.1/size102324/4